ncbi:MAG: hypothetical protein HY904_26520 [Deltaproteobacteria bacterium]|nr:hypothetical protein [Deltaproteobacteria bacterium]
MVFDARARGALWVAVGLLAAGCGFNVGDIDRTQPDKVKKTVFQDGEPWYFRQTVIDLPATSDVSFIGEQGDTTKVVWRIDEGFLYAYRAYEQLKGGEEWQQRPGVPWEGTPVAAFAISSHFDVQREYNPQTGEQTNVISENTTDRPWYEREYMRVDWSTNLVTDFRFVGASVNQQPVGRYVREGEASKDAAKITDGYVDIVHEMITQPEVNEQYTAWFGFPILDCWLYQNIYTECLGSRVKVRSSFLKVDKDHAYEPLTFDDHKFAKFGYFRVDRYGYDRRYGVVDTAVDYLIERFNLWRQRPGEASCRDDSLVHPWQNCTNDRIQPVVYYANEDMPAYLANGNKRIGDEWNRVMKEAVSEMTGRPVADLPDVWVWCPHNPVQDGDPVACGAPGLNPQIGDLRYNFIYYIRGMQKSSPLGYGPHAPDPETGEVISANAFIYGGAEETYAQYVLDFIKLQNGDLSVNDLYNGQNIVQHYQRMTEQRALNDRARPVEDWVATASRLGIKEKAATIREQLNRNQLKTDLIPGRLQKVKGTELESVFFNEDMRRALLPQFESAADVPPQFRPMMSPTVFADPAFSQMNRDRLYRLSRAGVEMTEFFEDDGTQGLARRLNCALPVPEDGSADPVLRHLCNGEQLNEELAYNYLLEEIHVGVTLHEVGHNMGLRHNFAGSTDAINFFPRYWELRSSVRAQGQQELHPEFALSSATEKQKQQAALDQGMREYQYSSIMDYGSKANSDFQGLGKYDRAAILYGYGQMVEVFDPAVAKVTKERAQLLQPIARHYLQYPNIIANDDSLNLLAKINTMYARKVMPESMVQASSTLVEVPYRFCSDEYVDGVYYCYRFDQGADAYEQVKNNAAMYENYYVFNGMRRNRVGFGMNVMGYLSRIYDRYFSFLSAQNKHFLNDNLVNRFWDAGCTEQGGVHFADSTCGLDRFAAAIESANALGRAIQTPEPGCYVRRKPGCYQDSSEDYLGLPASIQKMDDAACAAGGDGLTLVKADDPYTLIENSFDCSAWRPLLTAGGNDIWEPSVELPLGVGRFHLDKYNRDAYGYSFYWKPVTIGSWWDTWLAMEALGDPYTDFIGVDSRGDARSYLISYLNLYRNDISTAVGGFITEQYNAFSPYVVMQNNQPQVRFRDMIINQGDALSQFPAPRVPAGAIGLNPDVPYTTQLQALFISIMYYSQLTDDQDFNQSMMIGKAGTTVDITVPPEIKNDPNRYVEITDPTNGAIYFAVKMVPDKAWFLDENPYFSAGYEWVKRTRDMYMTPDGKAMKPGASITALRNDIRMWDIARAMLHLYNYGDGYGFAY